MSNNRSNNNNNNKTGIQPFLFQDSSESSIEVRQLRPRDPDTPSTESDTDGSVDSQARRPRCTVKVKFGSVWKKQSISEVATIKATQDVFHQCRVYTKEPNKQRRIEEEVLTRVWSRAGGCVTFELKIREKRQPLQVFGPLTEAKTKELEQHLKRKREDA